MYWFLLITTFITATFALWVLVNAPSVTGQWSKRTWCMLYFWQIVLVSSVSIFVNALYDTLLR